MLKKAEISDLLMVTQLAIRLWLNQGFDSLKEEIKETLLSLKAVFFLYIDNNSPVGFAQYGHDRKKS